MSVKRKVVPTCGSEMKVMSPPMRETRRLEMVRPMPVPPCRRAVLLSAWEGGGRRGGRGRGENENENDSKLLGVLHTSK